MIKKIILINPYPKMSKGINEATIYPPLGLAYLASFLRENGFPDVTIIDANILQLDNETVIKELIRSKPDIVGIHMNVILGRPGIVLSRLVKDKIGCLIAIGGPLVSSNPAEIVEQSLADVAVIGEGEQTFLEICQGRDMENIKGIAYVKDGKIKMNSPRELIDNIDSLPYPAYDLLPDFNLYKSRARKKPVGVILTSRGCPYQCTYCNSTIFGKRYRPRSPKNVIGEIDLLVRRFKIKQLDILDDNFTLDIKRAEAILDLIIGRNYKILLNLQNGVRADSLSSSLVAKMKRAGVFKVGIGIESGDPEILKSIKKGLSQDKVIRAIQMFRENGIITIGFFITGFPDETKESVEKTIRFAIKANPTIANFCILIPFPGTEIYSELKSTDGLKEPDRLFYDSGFYEGKVYHRCRHLSEEEIVTLHSTAYSRFHLRPGKVIEILFGIRSIGELKWTLEAGFPLLGKIFDRMRGKGMPITPDAPEKH